MDQVVATETIIPTNLNLVAFTTRVYQWMVAALLTTSVTAGIVASSPTLLDIFFGNVIIFYGLLILELGLVFFLSARIQKMSSTMAIAVFTIYSILNGVTMSVILLAYTAESVAATFGVTALTFGAMSLYGATTKRDLTTIGHLAFMALIGLIIATIVNLFLANSSLNLIISYAGVLIFVALTAYDTQKLKTMASSGANSNLAILGALSLYLDFINLFLFLLRLMGVRRR